MPNLPFISTLANRLRKNFDSADYWTNRYEEGRNSGAGSYGRLAEYKAKTINALVTEKAVSSVVEFGSGDGNQASLFEFPNYTGLDVSPLVVERARDRFGDREGWAFDTVEAANVAPRSFDMSMSLDVIYHLVEDTVFDTYMHGLFAAADRFVLIYASDHDAETLNSHVRHRAYSDWVAAHAPEFQVARTLEQPFPKSALSRTADTSFAFFRLFERREA